MTSSFARWIASLALIAALLISANDGYGLPEWLGGVLIGLGAITTVNMTIAAARLDRREREQRATRVRL
jgi:hypothetical protein